jgi:hypothetical protein
MFKKRLFRMFGLIVIIFVLAGCTHHYVPNAGTFRLDEIREFSSENSIWLENAQIDSEDLLFATNMGHEFYGKLNTWTETAITITQRELSKRSMLVTASTSKKLKLSINSIVGTFGFAVIRVETTLKAETSDGYENTYIGDNRSPATIYRAADGAVMRAVAEMLRDSRIVDFLTK